MTQISPEEALLKACALQNAIFNSEHFSSIATDERGVVQLFNVGAERMLGYAAIEVVDKMTPADISDPQELIARAEALSLKLATPISPGFEALVFKATRGIEDIYELTYIRKDGSRFPAVVSVTALRDPTGGIIGYLLIGTDNTARKQAEEALLKSSALQNAIFNSEHFSSIATDERGVVQLFNIGAQRMLGYTAIEVVNKITPAAISDPRELIARAEALSLELATPISPGFEALVFKATRGIEDIYELTYIRKDGSRFPAVVSVTALRDPTGAIIGYLLIGTDNTARKEVEEALLKAGALQNAIFNSEHFSCIATDQRGVVQLFNVGAERMLGYTAIEVVNKITPDAISDPAEVIARAKALSLEFATPISPGFEALVFKATRGIEDIYELTYIRKDGTRFPAVVSVTALRDPTGAIIGYLLIGTDNTARKLAEEALLKARAAQADTMCRLQASNKELEAFAFAASHDLKAPLRVIENCSRWIEEDLAEHLSGDARENMTLMRGRVKRMETLLDDLLEYARIGQPTDAKYAETIAGDALMHNILELLAPQGFTVNVSPSFAGIQVQAMPLQQILMNLISNACKHHHKKNGCIEITVEDAGNCYAFAVKDDGPGIPAQFHSRIFEMFQTLKPRDQVEGSGMGLAMVRKNLELFGGVLQLDSAEGKGSTFRFTWPKQQQIRNGPREAMPANDRC
jgi:signal transduction histidine kinase